MGKSRRLIRREKRQHSIGVAIQSVDERSSQFPVGYSSSQGDEPIVFKASMEFDLEMIGVDHNMAGTTLSNDLRDARVMLGIRNVRIWIVSDQVSRGSQQCRVIRLMQEFSLFPASLENFKLGRFLQNVNDSQRNREQHKPGKHKQVTIDKQ